MREYMRAYRKSNGPEERTRKTPERLIIGIDGEGFDGKDGVHRYVYMSASTKAGLVSEIENQKGLTTAEILEWIVSFPRGAQLFMFAAQYDWTHWMRDLSNRGLYSLWRPEEREFELRPKRKQRGKKKPKPHDYKPLTPVSP